VRVLGAKIVKGGGVEKETDLKEGDRLSSFVYSFGVFGYCMSE